MAVWDYVQNQWVNGDKAVHGENPVDALEIKRRKLALMIKAKLLNMEVGLSRMHLPKVNTLEK